MRWPSGDSKGCAGHPIPAAAKSRGCPLSLPSESHGAASAGRRNGKPLTEAGPLQPDPRDARENGSIFPFFSLFLFSFLLFSLFPLPSLPPFTSFFLVLLTLPPLHVSSVSLLLSPSLLLPSFSCSLQSEGRPTHSLSYLVIILPGPASPSPAPNPRCQMQSPRRVLGTVL